MPDRPDELGSSKTPRRGSGRNGGEHGAFDARFDRWLSCRLHDAYDNVLKEHLPPDLARLVELLKAQGEEDGTATETTFLPKDNATSNDYETYPTKSPGFMCGLSSEE